MKTTSRAIRLAIEHLNGGGGLVSKISTLSGKGVLGKKIIYKYADTQTQPNPAVQGATTFITQDKAIMITGCVSSAVAIALEKLAQRDEGRSTWSAASGANETTSADCQRYGFRSQPSAYMGARALAPVLGQGATAKNRKAIYLVPDYAYGHSVEQFDQGIHRGSCWGGNRWRLRRSCPLGTADYSSFSAEHRQ